ncbi:MAG: GIN domain-containing protein [Massilia sp.]
MKTLFRVGLSLLVLAFILIGLSYSMLRAKGVSSPVSVTGRDLESVTRQVGAQVRVIDLNGPIDLTVRQGATASLEVKGEQRLLANIDTSSEGDTIHIGTTGMLLYHRQPLQVVLVLPALREVHIRGDGDSTVNGFSGDAIDVRMEGRGTLKFNGRYSEVEATVRGTGEVEMNGGASKKMEATLEGSGKLTVVGSSKELKAVLAGSGDFNARHLKADIVDLTMMGSGSAIVNAATRFETSLRGSGDIAVYGNPQVREVNVNGSGSVSYKD